MISPHTPPGTLVVYRPAVERPQGRCPLPRLVSGRTYTVDRVVCTFDDNFALTLVEVDHGWLATDDEGSLCSWAYHLEDFDHAVLPKCLTECLTTAPVDDLVAA